MIRALLYRLLIISAHLQRHGIRLLIAIGRFNARAAAFGADPPAPFDSTNLPLLCLSFVALLHPPPSLFFFLSISSRWSLHRRASVSFSRNPLQLSALEAKGQRLPQRIARRDARRTRNFARLAALASSSRLARISPGRRG